MHRWFVGSIFRSQVMSLLLHLQPCGFAVLRNAQELIAPTRQLSIPRKPRGKLLTPAEWEIRGSDASLVRQA